MSYIVLARKYRPQLFKDVVGQKHVCQILQNSIIKNRIAHAYVFSGQRGTGKTTIARIFAKALNCKKGPAKEPCNSCENCIQITDGSSVDVLEIDGASNRGIDEIRALRENVKYIPASSRYKIYIIDEAHQITEPAFNALLKTIEEPPEHSIFMMATTEPEKIPLTILSRCQRFAFSPIPTEMITDKLEDISKKENFKIDKNALMLIARISNGSLRDSLSILDQVVSMLPEDEITYEKVMEFLGLSPIEIISSFVKLISEKNNKEILKQIQFIEQKGYDLKEFVKELREYIRRLIIVNFIDENDTILSKIITPEEKKWLYLQKNLFDMKSLLRNLYLINKCIEEMRWSDNPKIILEIYMLKATLPVVDIDDILKKIDIVEGKNPENNEDYYVKKEFFYSQGKTSETVPVDTVKDELKNFDNKTIKNSEGVEVVNENNFTEMWNKVVDQIAKKNLIVANSLQESLANMISEDVIKVYVPEGLHYSIIKDYAKLIEQELSEIYGRNIKFLYEKSLEKKKAVNEETLISVDEYVTEEPAEIYTTGVDSSNETVSDSDLKKIIDAFNGKIIK